MKQTNKKILLILAIIALVLILVFLVGTSFGFFKYAKKGDKTNIISIKGITTEILNSETDTLNLDNDPLDLENAYPMSDIEGTSQKPFEFVMNNTSNRNIAYTIKIEIDEQKMSECTLEDGTICPELSTEYIKYTYKKNDGEYIEPRNLGADNNIIATGMITTNESITSSIIIWIDNEAGNEIMNHYFYGKIIITGEEIAN